MTRALAVLVLFAALPSQALTDRSGPYELQVLINGAPARTFRHDGETFVLGQLGERYTLRVVNHGGRRVEAVVSVDGRDVIDGKPADWHGKRGYLVPAWSSVDIDGWRISQREAAAFRFSTVSDSYAGEDWQRTRGGCHRSRDLPRALVSAAATAATLPISALERRSSR